MPLISVEELTRRIGEPHLRVVDVRWYLGRPAAGRDAYEAGHIPGAIHLDLDRDLSAEQGPGRHPLPTPAAFRSTLMKAGIGTANRVVAYDDAGGANAARLWWMLDNLGHRGGTAVLDGGLQAWVAAGQPLSSESHAWPAAAALDLAAEWTNVIDRESLAERLGSLTLVDVRAPERYRGEVEPIDPVAGHIPTAISAPATGNLGPDGRFLPAEELGRRYAQLAADGAPLVTSCGSGVTACHTALAMRIGGLDDPLLYPGSYSDWSRSGMRIATGPEPGLPPARAR